jgi:hypothetical protein
MGMTEITMRWATTGLSTDAADVDAAILWCMDKFNDEVSYGTKWNYAGHAVFTFADEEDAVLFALRWV